MNHCCSSLHIASEFGHLECVRNFIDSGAYLNAKDYWNNGFSALHYSLINNHNDCARILIESGADIKIKRSYGFTPLHDLALFDNKHEGIRLLLEFGDYSILNEINDHGHTALDLAKGPTKKFIQEWINEEPIKESEL